MDRKILFSWCHYVAPWESKNRLKLKPFPSGFLIGHFAHILPPDKNGRKRYLFDFSPFQAVAKSFYENKSLRLLKYTNVLNAERKFLLAQQNKSGIWMVLAPDKSQKKKWVKSKCLKMALNKIAMIKWGCGR